MNFIHLNDTGTVFQLTIQKPDGTAYDLSSATTKEIVFVSPVGSFNTKAASFTTNGTDGKIKYTTVSGDITVIGEWKLYVHIVTPTYDRRSTMTGFKVEG